MPTLLGRIRRRGIDYEQAIDEGYLGRLSDAYTRFFHHYDDAPPLIVNTDRANFVDNPAHFGQLMDQINDLRSGRRFYNPAGDAPL